MTSQCSDSSCNDTIRSVELYALIFVPLQYVLIQLLLIVYALCKRSRELRTAQEHMTGVEPCLLVRTRKEEQTMDGIDKLRWWQRFTKMEF